MDPIKRIEQIAKKARQRKASSPSTADNHQLTLFEELLPSPSGNPQYPTLFTRCPVFAPVKERKSLDTDWENGHVIETSWGRIVRYGPGLDCTDEDVLIAIYHLCQQKRLKGPRKDMPVPVLRVVTDRFGERQEGYDEEVEVLAGTITAYQVCKFLGRVDRNGKVDGNQLKVTRQSIKRLVLTKLFIVNSNYEKEGTVSFFDYIGDQDYRGELFIQFHPVVVRLLKEYTYIDINIRRHLADVGKAVHKFLSSQPRQYEIGLEKLKTAIGYPRPMKKFKGALIAEMDKLVELGWLKYYEVSGTGRRIPFKLTIIR